MLDLVTFAALAASIVLAAIPALAQYLIAAAIFAVGAIAGPLVLGYTFGEARKFIASWAVLIGSGAALFITGYDPNLTEAVALLAGNTLGLVEVFVQPRVTAQDFSKALGQLRGSALSVVAFFAIVPASTEAYIAAVLTAVVGVMAVREVRNEPTVVP